MQIVRGTPHEFKAEFLDADGNPLVAADAGVVYPTVSIKDPDGQVVTVAVGKPIGNGQYVFSWTSTSDATINAPGSPWSIEWFFVTVNGYNKDYKEPFDLIDAVDPEDDNYRGWTYITRQGIGERLILRLDSIPESVSLQILDESYRVITHVTDVSEDLNEASLGVALADRKIGQYVDEGGRYVYIFNTDPLSFGEYIIFWNVQQSTVSVREDIQQLLRVPEMQYFRLNHPVRMLVDRLQKRIGWIQAYDDGAIYEFILRGLGKVNLINPTTNWTLGTIPFRADRGVMTALIMSAGIYALISQQIVEEELNFDHGGQSVTLNYSRDYGGVIGLMNTELTAFAESKPQIHRIANGVGVVGVRPKNYRYNQRVWRVDNWGSGSPYDVSAMLTSVGLG